MRLRVTDQSNVLYFAAVCELCSDFFFADDEGEVSNEDGLCEILPRVDAGVSSASGDGLMFTLLLL